VLGCWWVEDYSAQRQVNAWWTGGLVEQNGEEGS